jgi:exopolyphosphatase/guanosine-5'-triphosphate,3'-diphosphate pyrophosphatase
MAEEARAAGVLAIAAVGTAVFRIAANGADAVAMINQRAGVNLEVLSGDEESRIAYLAASSSLPDVRGTTVVFDTGGGSSQFTYGRSGTIQDRFSVNVGAVAVTEQFGLAGAVSADVIDQAKRSIAAGLGDLDTKPQPEAVVGMGGAVTNVTAVSKSMAEYDPDQVQGVLLTAAEIDRQIELYRTRTADERRSIPGLQPKRAEVILAGACNVRTILEKLGAQSLTVSDRGLRHGVLMEKFR